MAAKSVHELISTWYGREEEEFVAVHAEPVFIGTGHVDAELIQTSQQAGTTWCVAISPEALAGKASGGPFVGTIFPLVGKSGPGQREILIGRSPFCDIVLDEPAVSELHCQIEKGEAGYSISDQGSTNGTLINGKPLEPPASHTLTDEDIVTVGQHSFQYFTPRILYTYLQLRPPR